MTGIVARLGFGEMHVRCVPSRFDGISLPGKRPVAGFTT